MRGFVAHFLQETGPDSAAMNWLKQSTASQCELVKKVPKL